MAMSKNLGMYTGVRNTLDQIRAEGKECVLSFETASKARYWRQRAYYFRKLLHEKQAMERKQTGVPSPTSTPYDDMVIRDYTSDTGEKDLTKLMIVAGDDPIAIEFLGDDRVFNEELTDDEDLSQDEAYDEIRKLLENPEGSSS